MIKLSKDGNEYILEYDKDSIMLMERRGFNIQKIDEQMMTSYPLMFQGAFYKNHKYMKAYEIDEIFNNLKNRNALMAKLSEMILEQYQNLIGDNNEGNVEWESDSK